MMEIFLTCMDWFSDNRFWILPSILAVAVWVLLVMLLSLGEMAKKADAPESIPGEISCSQDE